MEYTLLKQLQKDDTVRLSVYCLSKITYITEKEKQRPYHEYEQRKCV